MAIHNLELRSSLFALITALLSMTAQVNAESNTEESPLLEMKRDAIRNGSYSSTIIGLSPSQEMAIGWIYINGAPLSPRCTGTVISYNAVITARHCFEQEPNDLLEIRSWHYAVPNPEVSMGVLSTAATFNFTLQDVLISLDYDVAIIRLAGEPFRVGQLVPIPVNTYPLERDFAVNLVGSKVEMAGYGETYRGEARSRFFAALSLDLITPDFLMVNGNNEQGVCNGDSGGPLLAAGINGEVNVFGVESNGDPCCVGIDQVVRLDIEEVQDMIRYAGAVPQVIERQAPACWGMNKSGRCQDDVLQECSRDRIVETDCADLNLSCVFLREEAKFGCGVSSCSRGEDYCVGNNIIRCERGVDREEICSAGSTCGYLEGSERPTCSPVGNILPPACDDKYLDSLREASQARFLAAPGCRSGPFSGSSDTLGWGWLIALILGYRIKRVRA